MAKTATTATAESQQEHPLRSGLLEAYCSSGTYPRAQVCHRDWLFMLDGLGDPVILRPHVRRGDIRTMLGRSEVGFGLVSVCPLVVAGAREQWAEAPFAYGRAVMYYTVSSQTVNFESSPITWDDISSDGPETLLIIGSVKAI